MSINNSSATTNGIHEGEEEEANAAAGKSTKEGGGGKMAGNNSGNNDPPMPWFGMDIGGTLTKLVYFEPTDELDSSLEARTSMAVIHRYLTTNRAYGQSGHRDVHLQMNGVEIRGRTGSIHFIRFPTSQMNAFIKIAKDKGMAHLASTVCATGGGAHKFEDDFRRQVKLSLNKFDEIDSLIHGLEFIHRTDPKAASMNEALLQQQEQNLPPLQRQLSLAASPLRELFYFERPDLDIDAAIDSVKVDFDASQTLYPFLLVNIGSGVSILSVRGPSDYQRVYGTSLGGGTFLGLCCLLTGCQTFEEAMELAASGDNKKVDKLVKDIYGSDYNRYGLSGSTVASSFGQMNLSDKRDSASKADLARATLVTITNNIGSLTRLCARAEGIERVVFVGNFLRINEISMRLLAQAMHFWSQGATKALFCRHEGYFGAIGCLLSLMKTQLHNHNQEENSSNGDDQHNTTTMNNGSAQT